MKLVCAGLISLALTSSASEVRGSELEIRLLQRVGSNVSKTGDPIQAVVITPVMEGKSVVIPPGAIVSGFVGRSDRLGLGLSLRIFDCLAENQLRFLRRWPRLKKRAKP